MIGEQVGAYTILSELGRGAVGVVYLAQHRYLNRKVAIKVLQAGVSGRSDLVSRFLAEARAASMIDHPGIVRVLDCDVQRGGQAYIVMEHLQGQTLRAHLASRGPLPVSEASSIAAQAAQAVAAAHAQGIVHRDLKPDNIFLLVKPAGAVRILDFGIAKLLQTDGAGPFETRGGLVLGTPSYMSPEQARGGAVDGRADVYSLGCILFEMLGGQPPFTASDAEGLLTAHLHQNPPAIESLAPGLPGSLILLLQLMLAKAPGERPDLAGQVIPTLQSLIAGEATVVGADGATAPVSAGSKRRRLAWVMVLMGMGGAAWTAHSRLSLLPRPAPVTVSPPPAAPVATPAPEQVPSPAPEPPPAVVPPPPPAPIEGAAAPVPAWAAVRPVPRRKRPAAPPAARSEGPAAALVLKSDPPGALVCVPGQRTRLGFTNVQLPAEAGQAGTLLVYRRGFHVETVTLPQNGALPQTIHLRPLVGDDLQAPPPCR